MSAPKLEEGYRYFVMSAEHWHKVFQNTIGPLFLLYGDMQMQVLNKFAFRPSFIKTASKLVYNNK